MEQIWAYQIVNHLFIFHISCLCFLFSYPPFLTSFPFLTLGPLRVGNFVTVWTLTIIIFNILRQLMFFLDLLTYLLPVIFSQFFENLCKLFINGGCTTAASGM